MRKGRNLWDHPVVRHRLQVGGYARIHNIARALEEERGITLTRQTVYNILRRRGVWVPPRRRGKPITPFEKPAPNMLWQADLIELEETCLGKVYAGGDSG